MSFAVSLPPVEENLSEQTASIPEAAVLDWRVTDAILAIARRWPGYLKLAWALVRDPRVPASARRWVVAANLAHGYLWQNSRNIRQVSQGGGPHGPRSGAPVKG